MMVSEFIERVKFEPTSEEYEGIEAEYMGTGMDKDQFCREWKKNGGVQRLCRIRARRIEELETEVARKDRQYEEMDTRHCKNFNQMNDAWKGKVSGLEEKIVQCEKLAATRHDEMASLKRDKDEVEEKLEIIRKAFAILGAGGIELGIVPDEPWYEEKWYKEDIENAMERAGIETSPVNYTKALAAVQGIFDDKSFRNDMLQEFIENAFE